MANVFFATPDMGVPLRRIPVHSYLLGTDYVIDLDMVAKDAAAEVRVGCTQAGWLQLSSNGGGSYDPIPDDVQSGIQLGPMTAGQHKAVKLKVAVPGGTALRHRFVDLLIGLGT